MNNNSLIYYALSFTAVVKAGGFSAAAKHSGISKSQLSRHVGALESLLSIQLLHRTTRTVTLTEQGMQFFAAFEAVEEGCIDAVNSLQHDFNLMNGTLRITAPIDFGIQFLPSIIHDFSKQYPNINVTLSLSNVNENITEQTYDLAIRIANQLPDSSLRMRTLMKFKRLICAAPEYFNKKKIPQHFDELKNHCCITSINRNPSILYPQWHFYSNGSSMNYRLEKFIEVDSLFAQLKLIKSGVGIGRMPDYFVRDELKSGSLMELFSEIEKPDSFVYLLYPDVKILPRKTRVFIDFLKDFIN